MGKTCSASYGLLVVTFMKAGDIVTLTRPARVDGYWQLRDGQHGSYDWLYFLPGTRAVVVNPRVPCVRRSGFFAHCRVVYMGGRYSITLGGI